MKLVRAVLLMLGAAASPAMSAPVVTLSYSTTNVTTAAYVQLVASTTLSSRAVEVCDTSGHLIKLATGASGSEVDFMTTAVGTTAASCVVVPSFLLSGVRLSLKAVDATANSGFIAVSLIP